MGKERAYPTRRLSIFATALVLLAASAAAPAQDAARGEPAAEVVKASGTVTATDRRDRTRTLDTGDEVFAGDVVETGTGRRTYVSLEFADGTRFALGPDSRLSVSEFVYRQSAQEDRITTRILRGAFRFVSGLIARRRPASMQVNLAVATIGIRGTTVSGEADAETATVVLDETEGAETPGEIQVSNAYGSVTINTAGWGTTVPSPTSAPTPPRRMQLRTIENLMRSLQSISVPRVRP